MKKAIIIKGKQHAGKSTTIREVCKLLEPTEVKKLNLYFFQNWSENQFQELCSKFSKDEFEKTFDIVKNVDIVKNEKTFENIGLNDIFLIKVAGKWILVVGGSPSEIKIHIVIIILLLIHIEIEISLVLTAVRKIERKNYKTKVGLESKGYEIIDTIPINKIEQGNFEETDEWKERIEKIINTIKENLNI